MSNPELATHVLLLQFASAEKAEAWKSMYVTNLSEICGLFLVKQEPVIVRNILALLVYSKGKIIDGKNFQSSPLPDEVDVLKKVFRPKTSHDIVTEELRRKLYNGKAIQL